MTKAMLTGWALSALIALSPAAHAEERPSHYKGLPADTLDDAVKNFSEYNRKLETLLANDSLSPDEVVTIHELTYTLRNALHKIDEELETLEETLEELHEASETINTETVLTKGREYLSVSRKIID